MCKKGGELMNNKNNNGKNNALSCLIVFAIGVICTIYFFANYKHMTGYSMNPLGYLFCVTPTVIGVIMLFFI